MKHSIFHRRCLFLCLVFVSTLTILSARLIHLQVVKADEYAEKSNRSSFRNEVVKAVRGCIIDTNKQLIARNIPLVLVALNKQLLQDTSLATIALANKELRSLPEWKQWGLKTRKKKIRRRAYQIKNEMSAEHILKQHLANFIQTFARPLGMTNEELKERIKLKKHYIVLKSNLSEDDAQKLKELTQEYSILHTLIFEEVQKRWYLMPEMASHVIGYLNHQGKGKRGIEERMDKLMSGKDGYIKNYRDRFDLLAVAKPQEISPPRHGLNLQLTLDMGIQNILEEELDAGLKKYQANKGTIIVMEPKTGAILGMASRPKYNLNTRENIATNGLDFATQSLYEPGSTFKIVAISAAIDQGLVEPTTKIFCHNGNYRFGPIRVPDHHGYGMLSIEQILSKSSNIGTYKVALKLEKKTFFDYIRAYGFGQKAGINMTSESRGIFNEKSENIVDFSRMSYGYSISVTPLQIAQAYCVLANGGLLVRPQLLKAARANSGLVVKKYKPKIIRRVIKKETAEKMRLALSKVVSEKGTARLAEVAGYNVAGKTATTVKLNEKNTAYLSGRYIVSFVGMLPADDPAFVCLVVLDDPLSPETERYGGTIAAPIFSKVAMRVANLIGIKPLVKVNPLVQH